MAALRQRYSQIVAGPTTGLQTFKSGYQAMEDQALATGEVPSDAQVSNIVTPLLDAVNEADSQLEQFSVPAGMRPDLHSLIAGYAALASDLRQLIALWPDAESIDQQEGTDIANLSSAASVFVADLNTGS